MLYRFLLNKWYFDEIYDFLFVRPAKWLGTLLWKGGDGGTIDGTLNGIAMGIVPWFTRLAGPGAVGLSLPLRLRHGAGAGDPDALARHRERRAEMNSLLSLVTFLPLIGAVVLLVFLRGEDEMAQRNAKLLALFTTTATFLLSLFVLAGFDPSNTGFQFVEERAWLGGLTYKMGVDGISVLFVMLTTFLMPLTIAASWNVTDRVKEYMVAFLVLETLMLGVFCALDLVLFYIFFEGGLIPMFLIIGIWGGRERIYAAFKFFLYTFFGSVLMLVAMIAMYYQAGTTDIPTLLDLSVRVGDHAGARLHRGRRGADADVARLLRELRGEDADVAGAHLAAGRARAGADGGVGDPGGDPAEDGRLRLPALLACRCSRWPRS